jgi:hypothetical protein
MPETFEPLTLQEITAVTAKEAESKIDPVWSQRISSLPVGGGFRINRVEGDPQRTLKTRINRAAEASYRKLTWYPQSGTLSDGKPSGYVVKVTSLDLKKKAEAETAQNAQNGALQPQQPTNDQNAGNPSPEENAAVGARRSRS